jgi:predicted ATPase with chaperone activity
VDNVMTEAPRPEAAPPPPPRRGPGPMVPKDHDEIGLPQGFLSNLILRLLYTRGSLSGDRLSSLIRLPFWALDEDLETFQKRKLVEVLRSEGMGRRGYIFELTAEGRNRARTLMQVMPYTGPAPVPLAQYSEWVQKQSIRSVHVGPEEVKKGLSHLVLDSETVELLGPAVNAARSMFLYGEAGNGKSTICEALVAVFPDEIFIPFAVHADGQVIQLFDPVIHETVEDELPSDEADTQGPVMYPPPAYDRRFIKIKRPMVMVGGELTLDQLELQWDANSGAYQAPPQMKANCGIFVIDDFGRQRLHPRELLNRWMVPLDRGVDFLSFTSGRRATIPFAPLVAFATNMDPFDLVEEAFLRRIRYKIEIKSPNKEEFTEIFRRLCARYGVPFDRSAVDFIYREYYIRHGIAPRGCHPRDLIADVLDLAEFLGRPPSLSEDMLDHACRSYFMSLQRTAEGSDAA